MKKNRETAWGGTVYTEEVAWGLSNSILCFRSLDEDNIPEPLPLRFWKCCPFIFCTGYVALEVSEDSLVFLLWGMLAFSACMPTQFFLYLLSSIIAPGCLLGPVTMNKCFLGMGGAFSVYPFFSSFT
jgi:hypothetical protein